jgi:acetate kinase
LRILVLNAGSSSLKASLIATRDRTEARTTVAWGADASRRVDRQEGLRHALVELGIDGGREAHVDGVGHRVVHGGERWTAPVRVDDATAADLAALGELAPLHNPVALDTMEAARRTFPDIPHVAAFDTAFHAGLPEAWRRYPVPDRWISEWGVRRYGFHGLSVAWSVRRASELLDRPLEDLRLVVAHLGSGCSVTAVDGGRSVMTSMGMTPLEGLMMGTRAGSIDPGVLLALLKRGRLSLEELAEALEHESGLLAVSGASSDMRQLATDAATGNARAALAIEMFVVRAAAGIAAAATSLETLDCLVFTGGIGEHAAEVRAAIVDQLGVLGIEPIDAGAVVEEDGILGRPASGPAVLRIEAREDLVIADEVERLLGVRS